jgi:GNAT superfamily N-acetyltransferase
MALIVRPARMSDKPALMAIAKKVWDGNDYLPVLFDRWVRKPGFWVGELSGRVVGCGKATHFGSGEWWLEGLRIDPDLRGHGLGTELSMAILKKVLKEKPVSLRLSTAEVNKDSVTIIGRMGFAPILASRLYWGARDMGAGHNSFPSAERGLCPKPTRRASASEALAYLADHDELWLSCGLLPHTWKLREVTPRYLTHLERTGCLIGFRERGVSPGLLIAQPHIYDSRNLDIGHVSGTPRSLAAFRGWLARRLRQTRGSGASAMAAGPEMRRALVRLGLKPERGIGRVLVFEYPV